MLDLGFAAGKRQRRTVAGRTRRDVADKLVKLRRENPATGAAATWTVERWMAYYLAEVVPGRTKPQTRRSYHSVNKTYIVPLIGRHRLSKLAPEHVQAMYNRMRQPCPDPKDGECPHEVSHGLKEKTLRNTHAVLRRALKIAVRHGHIERNVAELVDPPGAQGEHRSPLPLDKTRLVLRSSSGTGIELRVYLRLYYGLRQGEVLGLEWAWVDFGARKFRIYRTVQKDDDGKLILGEPKTKKSRRWLPMVTPVEARFKVAWAGHLADHPECGSSDCAHVVFTGPTGGLVDPKRDWEAWRDLLASAGVEHHAPHAARNTAVTLLKEAGVDQIVATAVAGHSTITLTADVYTEADIEYVRRQLEQYTAFIGEPELEQ
jgi:integrase